MQRTQRGKERKNFAAPLLRLNYSLLSIFYQGGILCSSRKDAKKQRIQFHVTNATGQRTLSRKFRFVPCPALRRVNYPLLLIFCERCVRANDRNNFLYPIYREISTLPVLADGRFILRLVDAINFVGCYKGLNPFVRLA